MSGLADAIEQLFAAFANVPKPHVIHGCPCCIDRKNIATLLVTPLREIRSRDLSSYAFSAFLTVGEASDYLYFLPRILEISAAEDVSAPDIEVTGRAVAACEPASWPSQRRDALRQFLFAVIGDAIVRGSFYKLDSWICAIARMGFEVGPHLVQLEKAPAAVLEYFKDNEGCLRRHNTLCNPFWELPSAAHDEIVRWFNSERIRKIPFEAYGYTPKAGN
jgi:hypothetical protein